MKYPFSCSYAVFFVSILMSLGVMAQTMQKTSDGEICHENGGGNFINTLPATPGGGISFFDGFLDPSLYEAWKNCLDSPGCSSNPAPASFHFAQIRLGQPIGKGTIHLKPTGSISNNTIVCQGESADIQVELQGQPPWSITWSDGVTQNNIQNGSFTRSVSPFLSTNYSITSMNDANCLGPCSGVSAITVKELPQGQVLGSDTICQGTNTGIQVNLTGTGPWDLDWSDGLAQYGVTTTPVFRTVSPGLTTVYSLTSLSDSNCSGTYTGVASITVIGAPSAVLSGETTISPGESTDLEVTLTGTPPWTLNWSDGTTQSNVQTSPTYRNVSPSATTTYSLISYSDADCSGLSSNNVTVSVVSSHDECMDAYELTENGQITLNISGNTWAEGDPSFECQNGDPFFTQTTWFNFTPLTNGEISLSVCQTDGGTGNSLLGIFIGACGFLSEVDCNDDYCGQLSEIQDFPVIEGITYFVCYATSGLLPIASNLVLDVSGSALSSSLKKCGNDTLRDITWSGDRFVSAGDGVILTAVDGIHWVTRYSNAAVQFEGLHAESNFQMAVGSAGEIFTSSDTVDWTPRNSGVTAPLNSCTGNGSTLVVVGASRTVLTSADGITWTTRNAGSDPASLFDVTWDGTQFIAVGGSYNSAFDSPILTSPDGVTWTPQASGTNKWIMGITWSGTKFVVVGADGLVLTSIDGISWQIQDSGTTTWLLGVDWNGTNFVATGYYGQIISSPDGVNWSSHDSGIKSHLFSVANDNTTFVSAGINGQITTSEDGINWTPQSTINLDTLTDIHWSGTAFTAVGWDLVDMFRGYTFQSYDGYSWNTLTDGEPNAIFKSITGNNSILVIGGVDSTANALIFSSPDGQNWTSRVSGTGDQVNSVDWNGVSFCSVGNNGSIMTSPDGITWHTQNSGFSNHLRAVTGGPGQWVAVGYNGLILTSIDGITWANRNSGTTENLESVAWNGTRLIAVGNAILISLDGGTTWNVEPITPTVRLNEIIWGGDKFVVVGNGGHILSTITGSLGDWTEYAPITHTDLMALDRDDTQYVFVGEGGTNMSSRICIPDLHFENYLIDTFDSDEDNTISIFETNPVLGINCSGREIIDLTGIESFTSLTELDFSNNFIQGPPDLRNLIDLEILNFSGNSLKRFPLLDSLSRPTGMTIIIGENNSLEELPKFSSMSNLQTLDVSGNSLKGLSTLSSLGGLQTLDVGENNLQQLPADLSTLSSLTSLDVSGNTITNLETISNLSGLTDLDIGQNGIQDLPDMSGLVNLVNADLSMNQLSLDDCSMIQLLLEQGTSVIFNPQADGSTLICPFYITLLEGYATWRRIVPEGFCNIENPTILDFIGYMERGYICQ